MYLLVISYLSKINIKMGSRVRAVCMKLTHKLKYETK